MEAELGTSLLMGAFVPGQGLAAKVVSVFPGNSALGRPVVTGLVAVLDPETGAPIAICDGTRLTALRTGAASGAATDLLAPTSARTAAVIGCGVQGRTQALAIDAVRELEGLRLFDRDPARSRALAEELAPALRARVRPVDRVEEALSEAEIVCLATTSNVPVLDGNHLAPGAHVNAVGSYTLNLRELDGRTIERARVFVDAVPAALVEAGDLVAAEAEGLTRHTDWIELGLVVAGQAAGRRSPEEITLFKSVGLAVQDVAASALAVRNARERGLGIELPS